MLLGEKRGEKERESCILRKCHALKIILIRAAVFWVDGQNQWLGSDNAHCTTSPVGSCYRCSVHYSLMSNHVIPEIMELCGSGKTN